MHRPKVNNEGAEVTVTCQVPRYANSTVLARDYQCQKLGLYGCCFCLGCVVCSGSLNCLDDVCFSWVDLVFVCFGLLCFTLFSLQWTYAAAAYWWYGDFTKLLFYKAKAFVKTVGKLQCLFVLQIQRLHTLRCMKPRVRKVRRASPSLNWCNPGNSFSQVTINNSIQYCQEDFQVIVYFFLSRSLGSVWGGGANISAGIWVGLSRQSDILVHGCFHQHMVVILKWNPVCLHIYMTKKHVQSIERLVLACSYYVQETTHANQAVVLGVSDIFTIFRNSTWNLTAPTAALICLDPPCPLQPHPDGAQNAGVRVDVGDDCWARVVLILYVLLY